MLHYFLQDENSHHWEAIQNLASSSSGESADKQLRKYVLEAHRLTSTQRNVRICVGETTIDGKTYKPGDIVACLFVRIPETAKWTTRINVDHHGFYRAQHAKTQKSFLSLTNLSSTDQRALTSTSAMGLMPVSDAKSPLLSLSRLSRSAVV